MRWGFNNASVRQLQVVAWEASGQKRASVWSMKSDDFIQKHNEKKAQEKLESKEAVSRRGSVLHNRYDTLPLARPRGRRASIGTPEKATRRLGENSMIGELRDFYQAQPVKKEMSDDESSVSSMSSKDTSSDTDGESWSSDSSTSSDGLDFNSDKVLLMRESIKFSPKLRTVMSMLWIAAGTCS